MSRTHRLAPIFLIISYLLWPFSLSFIRSILSSIAHHFTFVSLFTSSHTILPLLRAQPYFHLTDRFLVSLPSLTLPCTASIVLCCSLTFYCSLMLYDWLDI